MPPVLLARLAEIPEGGMVCRVHGARQVALVRIQGEVFAIDDLCTHAGASLHEGELGRMGDYLVTCPWHEAHFDVRTGRVHQDTDWATDTTAYRVELRGDEVWVDLP
ncbi:MAG TPA: nitrite reductase (NAD(P)H) small subunit [Thermoanaerobaculia bacterium]|nr:nitrite reductase (NAD(P)H) small subunit [Thermoanaerobaculia bacterium]